MTDDRTAVAAALQAVGAHRWVSIEVTQVMVEGVRIEIDLNVHYARATPVCCGEPACYIGFLGQHRTLLPDAIGHALGIERPAVTIRAHLRHEPGYRYIDHRTGRLHDEGVDQTHHYGPEQFR